MLRFRSIFLLLLLSWINGFSQNETKAPAENAEKPYLIVTQAPQFPGGSEAMIDFIQEHLQYPEEEKKKNIQGTIFMQFIVEKDGSLSDIKAVKTVEGGVNLEKEAERVIRLMPKWTPGTYENKVVRVYKSVPFYFVLAKTRTSSHQ